MSLWWARTHHPGTQDQFDIQVTTVHLLQDSPGTHLSTSPEGRMNGWVGWVFTAQAGTWTQAHRFLARCANYCVKKTGKYEKNGGAFVPYSYLHNLLGHVKIAPTLLEPCGGEEDNWEMEGEVEVGGDTSGGLGTLGCQGHTAQTLCLSSRTRLCGWYGRTTRLHKFMSVIFMLLKKFWKKS